MHIAHLLHVLKECICKQQRKHIQKDGEGKIAEKNNRFAVGYIGKVGILD